MVESLQERYWPRRLLHVPSMTSLERAQNCHYGPWHKPSYNALSYTWGRYTSPKGPTISISNIAWSVQSIRPEHFTVSEFQHALYQAAGGEGLVWVDVACIDQENTVIKMDEIGHQADIFRRASQVYVWLTKHSVNQLATFFVGLDKLTSRLEKLEHAENSPTFKDAYSVLRDTDHVQTAVIHLRRLLDDGWFSSLWTLQEACLSESAILFSRSAETILIMRYGLTTSRKVILSDLISDCQTIQLALIPYRDQNLDTQKLLSLIDKSGLSLVGVAFSSKPTPLLYNAAHYRTTANPLDRVYGIMQVFDLQLGSAREPSREFTLEELEDQLGEAFNADFPVTAQLNVHTVPPLPGKAWRISQASILPDLYHLGNDLSPYDLDSCCTILKQESQQPVYSGQICSFGALYDFWLQSITFQEGLFQKLGWRWQHYHANIHLDALQNTSSTPTSELQQVEATKQPQNTCPCNGCAIRPEREKNGLVRFLASNPQLLLESFVLRLGKITLFRFTPRNRSETVAAWAGLLVIREKLSGIDTWRRIGICSWEGAFGARRQSHKELWSSFQGFLG